jgi:hypothetical protein
VEMGEGGGAARARTYTKAQLRSWGKLGGRPTELNRQAVARLRTLLVSGKSQAECAKVLGVSTRTIGRAVG